MKRGIRSACLFVVAALLCCALASDAWSVTHLIVVRHPDNTLWKLTCDASAGPVTCSTWQMLATGRFSMQPTLTWDAVLQKYVLIGVGNDQVSIFRSTFEPNGTWNGDWTKIAGVSASPVAVSGGYHSHDTSYLNTSGDTMTGTLTLQNGLSVAGGSIGVGTASPAQELHVKGSGWLQGVFESTTSSGGIQLISAPLPSPPNPANTPGGVYELQAVIDGSFILYDRKADRYVLSANKDGNVGIGTMTPTYRLHVAGSAAVVSLRLSSDSKWKKNVSTIDGALDKVALLRGVEFEWRTDEFPREGFSKGKKIGLVAQEVESVLPQVVSTQADGAEKSVEYANLVAVLVEAVKELRQQNERLKARVEALEGRR